MNRKKLSNFSVFLANLGCKRALKLFFFNEVIRLMEKIDHTQSNKIKK